MTELSLLFEVLGGARKLVDAARVEGNARADRRRVKHTKEIIEALRLIYFAPRGVISLLDQIIEGSRPSQAQIEIILPEFNDAEPFVEHMLRRLDPFAEKPDKVFTLKAQRVLREISFGKGGIRHKVQNLLNAALTYGEEISSSDAEQLREEILALNKAIEDAEEALVLTTRGL